MFITLHHSELYAVSEIHGLLNMLFSQLIAFTWGKFKEDILSCLKLYFVLSSCVCCYEGILKDIVIYDEQIYLLTLRGSILCHSIHRQCGRFNSTVNNSKLLRILGCTSRAIILLATDRSINLYRPQIGWKPQISFEDLILSETYATLSFKLLIELLFNK